MQNPSESLQRNRTAVYLIRTIQRDFADIFPEIRQSIDCWDLQSVYQLLPAFQLKKE